MELRPALCLSDHKTPTGRRSVGCDFSRASSVHLMTRSRVFHLTASAWSRIQPELTMDEQCEFMADYLLECIPSNPQPLIPGPADSDRRPPQRRYPKHLQRLSRNEIALDSSAAGSAGEANNGGGVTASVDKTQSRRHRDTRRNHGFSP